jgi:hypothetical protein
MPEGKSALVRAIEVTVTRVPQITTEVGPFEHSAESQAVFVDLPAGKISWRCWHLVRSERATAIRSIFVPRVFQVKKVEDLPKLRGRRELAPDQMPTLITVADPADAKTAQVVSLSSIDSLLGAHLRSISVEMTTDPLTAPDIELHLPFLVKERDQHVAYRYPHVFTPFYSSFVRR